MFECVRHSIPPVYGAGAGGVLGPLSDEPTVQAVGKQLDGR